MPAGTINHNQGEPRDAPPRELIRRNLKNDNMDIVKDMEAEALSPKKFNYRLYASKKALGLGVMFNTLPMIPNRSYSFEIKLLWFGFWFIKYKIQKGVKPR